MLRAIVVDDEPITAEMVGRYLEATGKVKVEKILNNPSIVMEEVMRLKPDVVFLDIEMPEISGLELAEKITGVEAQTEVVFITAYSNYAVEAFKVNALDYVMKPINPKELERVIHKISRRYLLPVGNTRLRINALEGCSAWVDGQKDPIKWSTAKCEELFAYMIFKKDSSVISKWKLIEVLWPEKDEQKSEINLRSTISRMNKTLREYGVNGRMVSLNNRYRLEIEGLEVDAFELERTSEGWLQKVTRSPITLQEFFKTYPGPLFAHQDYGWAEGLRSYYLRIFVNWGKELVRYKMEQDGDMHGAYQMLEYMVAFDPYNEDLREMAIKILYSIEGKKAVSDYYLAFERQLESQIGVEPRLTLKELYQRLLVSGTSNSADDVL